MKSTPVDQLTKEFVSLFSKKMDSDKAERVVNSLKERVTFLPEMKQAGDFYFNRPTVYDPKTVKKKWNNLAKQKVQGFATELLKSENPNAEEVKEILVNYLSKDETPIGKVMPALRLALTGAGGGPDLMEIISILGSNEVLRRINLASEQIKTD